MKKAHRKHHHHHAPIAVGDQVQFVAPFTVTEVKDSEHHGQQVKLETLEGWFSATLFMHVKETSN